MSRKVKIPKIVLRFEPHPDGEAAWRRVYDLIFSLARKELIEERLKKDKGEIDHENN